MVTSFKGNEKRNKNLLLLLLSKVTKKGAKIYYATSFKGNQKGSNNLLLLLLLTVMVSECTVIWCGGQKLFWLNGI